MVLDSMVTASVRPRQEFAWDYFRILIRRRTRHFDRPAAALNCANELIPGTTNAVSTSVFRFSKLPFRYSTINVLGYGSGDTVFTLKQNGELLVVKVQRDSLGKNLGELLQLVWARRDTFETVTREYNQAFDLFPATHFLVVHGPLMGMPAVVSIQPFIAGQKRDLLYGFSDDELVELLSSNDRLRQQLHCFVQTTSRAFEIGEWLVDLGKNNLLLIESEGEMRLVFTDTEMLQAKWAKDTGRFDDYCNTLLRMKRILEEAEVAGLLLRKAG